MMKGAIKSMTTVLRDANIESVVMLTWSDWMTEPRSNRYHYATRFARHVPVFFVQPDSINGKIVHEVISINESTTINVVHCPPKYDNNAMKLLEIALSDLGARNALVWAYNVWFAPLVVRCRPVMVVYHATEDYFASGGAWRVSESATLSDINKFLSHTDLIQAVSPGVAESFKMNSKFNCQIVVVTNGCDFDFWQATGAANYIAPARLRPAALYQGGINVRLDYNLIRELATKLPDWEFWFCGRVTDEHGEWNRLLLLENVKYFGELDVRGVAALCQQARVGIIPFEQVEQIWRSLPLKAYEYVACGLPVVTVPIEALNANPELFTIARNADEFAVALCEVEKSRCDPSRVAARMHAAEEQSYERHFAETLHAIKRARESLLGVKNGRLNILMLYDDQSSHVGTIREHLDSFAKYSENKYFFLAASGVVPGIDGSAPAGIADLEVFDAVGIHYSLRLSILDHLSLGVAELVRKYRGLKFLFIQDEYDTPEVARVFIETLGVRVVFTNVPLEQIEFVYPSSRFPLVQFIPTLTGYVPEGPVISNSIKPLSSRKTRIGYRGRRLPHHYGRLGFEKLVIGLEMKRLAAEHNVPVDIEVEDDKRIYGAGWYDFLGSCRATLGTESGSNIFDDDGSLAKLSAQHKEMGFEEFEAEFLFGREGPIRMNQISPKIFEAIRLRTALVLFEGNYSGVLAADKHYIPLKKDFSNVAEVFCRLEDIQFLTAITDQAYDDVISSGKYSYATFVAGIDEVFARRCSHGPRFEIFSSPILIWDPANRKVESLSLGGLLISDKASEGRQLTREDLAASMERQGRFGQRLASKVMLRATRGMGTSVSEDSRSVVLLGSRRENDVGASASSQLPLWVRRLMIVCWHRLPASRRYAIANWAHRLRRRS